MSSIKITESLTSNKDCLDNYNLVVDNNTTQISYNEVMVKLYRILDGKHDFEGGSSSDRSYINKTDCDNSIAKEQLIGLVDKDLATYYLTKDLVREDGSYSPLINKQLHLTANSLHDIFDFTTGLEKYPFKKGDKIKVSLFHNENSNPIKTYCLDRPFHSDYRIVNKNKQIDLIELKRLNDDRETYGNHGIFSIRVGNKNNLKGNQILRDELAKTFKFTNRSYTIDATHISKDTILEPLFGVNNKSQAIFGDHLDPASVKNEQTNGVQDNKQNNSYTNRFHYCFLKGIPIELEISTDGNNKGKIQFTFHRSGNKSTSFFHPSKKIADISGFAPSVADISLFIYNNILTNVKKKKKTGCVFSLLGSISTALSHGKKAPKGETARQGFFSGFFNNIITSISQVIDGDISPSEILVILTSLKTIGDQLRLSDAQILSHIYPNASGSYCITLDKFLFDFGVASRKCLLLGDSPSVENFELHVYENKLDREELLTSALKNQETIKNMNVGPIIDLQTKYGNEVIESINLTEENIQEIEQEKIKEIIKIQENIIADIKNEKNKLIKTDIYNNISTSLSTIDINERIKNIEEKIQIKVEIANNNLDTVKKYKQDNRRYNIAEYTLSIDETQTQTQTDFLNECRLLHVQYYIFQLLKWYADKNPHDIELIILTKLQDLIIEYILVDTIDNNNFRNVFDKVYFILKHQQYDGKPVTPHWHLLTIDTVYYSTTSNGDIKYFDSFNLPDFGQTGGAGDEALETFGNEIITETQIIESFIFLIETYTTTLRSGNMYLKTELESFITDANNFWIMCMFYVESNGYEKLLNLFDILTINDSELNAVTDIGKLSEDVLDKSTIELTNIIANSGFGRQPLLSAQPVESAMDVEQPPAPPVESAMDVEQPPAPPVTQDAMDVKANPKKRGRSELDEGERDEGERDKPNKIHRGGAYQDHFNKLPERLQKLSKYIFMLLKFIDSTKLLLGIKGDESKTVSLIETSITKKDGKEYYFIKSEDVTVNYRIVGNEKLALQLPAEWNSNFPDKNISPGYIVSSVFFDGIEYNYLNKTDKQSGIHSMSDISSTDTTSTNDSGITVTSNTSTGSMSNGGKGKKRTKRNHRKTKNIQKMNRRSRKKGGTKKLTFTDKLKMHKEGDTFAHEGKEYTLGKNKHYTTKPLTTLADKLKAHKEGDTFGHEGKKYTLGPNKHLSVVGGKKTRRKKSNRRTKKKTSKK